jgi:hypothetical protein
MELSVIKSQPFPQEAISVWAGIDHSKAIPSLPNHHCTVSSRELGNQRKELPSCFERPFHDACVSGGILLLNFSVSVIAFCVPG